MPEAIERNYREILRRARAVLDSGRGVILDATFATRGWREAAAELARGAGARFTHLETCCTDRTALRARLAARRTRPSVSDATDVELDHLLDGYESFASNEAGPHATIDTSGDPAVALAVALGALEVAGVQAAQARRAS